MTNLNLESIKQLMFELSCQCTQESELHRNCIWFSEINYTTTGEYLGEVGLFIKQLIADNLFPQYGEKFRTILKYIHKLWDNI